MMKQLRGADRKTLHDLVRFLTGSCADLMDDYFESDIVKSAIASSGIIGNKVGPMSQGSGLVLLYHLMGEQDGQHGAWGFHKGGNGGFTQVLQRAAESFGATVRARGPRRPRDHPGRQGDRRRPRPTARSSPRRSWSAPSTRGVPSPSWSTRASCPSDLNEAIDRYRFQGTSAKVNFALDDLPVYPALKGRIDHFGGFVNIGPSLEYLERAYDDAKYGWYSRLPYIDGAIQSVVDPDMAPPGKHVMSCFIQYAPYELKGSDWDTEREPFGDTVQAVLETHFPGFGDLVLHREVVTPLDIERVAGLTEGNIFHGEFLAPQMYFMRPAPGLRALQHADRGLLPVRLGHPPRRLRHRWPRQARRPADPRRPEALTMYLILGIIVFGMGIGAVAQLILGRRGGSTGARRSSPVWSARSSAAC